MYSYKSLDSISYEVIADCFNSAFSDYALPMKMTSEQIKKRLEMSGINKQLSYGAFINDEMVGFIFNSCNEYNGENVAFDIGTAIVPNHRGNKVFSSLFKFTANELIKHNIKKYYLEVLQQNESAIAIYKKQDFCISREYSVLKSEKATPFSISNNIKVIDYSSFKISSIDNYIFLLPSFEHCESVLKLNPELYAVAKYENASSLTAYCVYSIENGSILQIGYQSLDALSEIIKYLLSKYETIIIKNMDLRYADVIDLLKSLGFTELVKQYEMVKDLL